MFERFTDRARRVVVLSQEEARRLDHNYIGTEHLLLGLLAEEDGVAAQALRAMDISLEAARSGVEDIIDPGDGAPSGHMPFTPRAKKVLELSLREALQLGHNYIGTEHILLGLIREGQGVAAQVLQKLGADLGRVRQQVIEILSARAAEAPQDVRSVSGKAVAVALEGDIRDEELRAVLAQALERLASLDREVTALRNLVEDIRGRLFGREDDPGSRSAEGGKPPAT